MSETRPGRRRRPKRRTGHEIIEAVLEASEGILAEDGLAGFTTNRLAGRAGVSVGSIYQYFESKRGVIAELARRLERRALSLALERVGAEPDADVPTIISTFVGVLIEGGMGDQRMRRALLLEVPRGWIEEESAKVDDAVEATIRGLIEARPDAVRQGDADIMAFIAHHAVEAVVEAAVLRRPDLVERPEFRDELEHLIARYVGDGRGRPR